MAARVMHRRQPDECVLRRIVEFCVRDRPAKLVEPARKQDGVVVENGRSETGDGGVKASRQLRESVAREAVNFSTRERAGAADTADDQRLAARKHRGGVIGARGVETGGNRPYAGRLRRCWKRKHQDDEQRLQDNGANATRRSAATLIDRFHIFPFPFPLAPRRAGSHKAGTALRCPVVHVPETPPDFGNSRGIITEDSL